MIAVTNFSRRSTTRRSSLIESVLTCGNAFLLSKEEQEGRVVDT